MTHQDVSIDDYHAGDAIEIPIIVEDSLGDRLNLTDADIEWLLKDEATDDDEEALLTKHTDEGPAEIEITDPGEGRATIKIDTGDTDNVLGDGEFGPLDNDEFHHRCRVWDADGRRSTVFHGTFTIHI